MRTLKFFILFLFSLSLNGQKVATLFVDSVSIKINDSIIFESFKTFLKFIPTEKSKYVTLFDNGIYKLVYGYSAKSDERIQSHVVSKGDLEMKIVTEYIDAFLGNDKEWNCSGLYTERCRLKSIPFEGNDQVTVNLRYRFFNLAPRDTFNYPYNYRQGEWVGCSDDAKEISVNYEKDKKNGLARVIYNNGAIYKTNFVNGFEENYGYGKFENYKFSNYIIPNIISMSCNPITSSFNLKKGHKYVNYKRISRTDNLSVNFKKKGLIHDSLEYNVQGDFVAFSGDTIIMKSDEVEVHDFYKKNTDSLHFFYKRLNPGFQKININDITLIKKRREVLQNSVITLTLLSLVSAVIVSPFASIQKRGFNTERFAEISGVSLGVAALSVTVGVLFGSKKFHIKSCGKKRNTWKIIPPKP